MTPVQLWTGSVLGSKNTKINLSGNYSDYKTLVFFYKWTDTGIMYQRNYWTAHANYFSLGPVATDANRWCYLRKNTETQLIVGDNGTSGGPYIYRIFGLPRMF